MRASLSQSNRTYRSNKRKAHPKVHHVAPIEYTFGEIISRR